MQNEHTHWNRGLGRGEVRGDIGRRSLEHVGSLTGDEGAQGGDVPERVVAGVVGHGGALHPNEPPAMDGGLLGAWAGSDDHHLMATQCSLLEELC